MPWLTVFLDGTGMFEDVPRDKILVAPADRDIKIGALSGGMDSGAPSVSFGITLPDGRVVFAETSMKLFHLAAKAFAARYGWQDEGTPVVEGQNRRGKPS